MARAATRTTDDRRQQAPPLTSMASARAQMHARRPSSPPASRQARRRTTQPTPPEDASTSERRAHTHTHARRSHSSLPMTARSAEAPPQRAASTASFRARAPAPTHRDAALLIETRPTIPRESRDCERRACAQPNKLATGSKRERRCGECDERERDKARASPTAPHDKDRHPPRRRNEQGERRATSVRPLALNNKRPAHTSGSR